MIKLTRLADLPGGYHHEHRDWFIGPVGQSRDSEVIERCNFDVVCRRMDEIDPEGNDHEVHRFGHLGWIEEIATRPNSACHSLAVDIGVELDGYPILDEMALSEMEMGDHDNGQCGEHCPFCEGQDLDE